MLSDDYLADVERWNAGGNFSGRPNETRNTIDRLCAEIRRLRAIESAGRQFRETRGRHDGEHDAKGGTDCSCCVAAYIAAEAVLDAALDRE